jgi:tetratricopeptide (TPR) repeat protein
MTEAKNTEASQENLKKLIQEAQLLLKQSRFSEALKKARKVLEIDAKCVKIKLIEGMALKEQGQSAESQISLRQALKLTEELLEDDHQNVELLIERARILNQLKRHDEALIYLKCATEQDSKAVEAALGKTKFWKTFQTENEQLTKWLEILKHDSNNLAALLKAGSFQLRLGEYKAARKNFSAYLGKDSNSREAHLKHAMACLHLHKYKEAINSFQQARLNQRPTPEERVGLGHALLGLQQWEKAQQEFQEAINLQADYLPALLGLSKALQNQEKYALACLRLEQLLKLDPTHEEAREALREVSQILDERPPVSMDPVPSLPTVQPPPVESKRAETSYFQAATISCEEMTLKDNIFEGSIEQEEKKTIRSTTTSSTEVPLDSSPMIIIRSLESELNINSDISAQPSNSISTQSTQGIGIRVSTTTPAQDNKNQFISTTVATSLTQSSNRGNGSNSFISTQPSSSSSSIYANSSIPSSPHASSLSFFNSSSAPTAASLSDENKQKQKQTDLQDKLIKACEQGNLSAVKAAIEEGANPDQENEHEKKPLYSAVYGMNPGIVKYLISKAQSGDSIDWAACKKHNNRHYDGKIFFKNTKINLGTYGEWKALLEKIEPNVFLVKCHLDEAQKVWGSSRRRASNFAALKTFVGGVDSSTVPGAKSNYRGSSAVLSETEKRLAKARKQIEEQFKPTPSERTENTSSFSF